MQSVMCQAYRQTKSMSRESKLKAGLLVVILCSVVSISQAQVQKDSLIFYRGQMLLGELLSIDEGRIHFDSDDAGVVSIKNYKLYTFSAKIHRYRIRTADERLLYGVIGKSEKEGFIIITHAEGEVEIPIEAIIALERFDNSFWNRMSGNFSAGYNFTKSSNIGRLNLDFSIRYLAQNFGSSFTGNFIMTQEGGTFSRDISNLTNASLINLNYNWNLIGILAYQRNLELGILRRYQEAGLIGYNLINRRNRQLTTGVGLAMNQELTSDENKSRNLFEVPWLMEFTFYQFQEPNIQMKIIEKAYFGITQQGRVRNDASLDLDWEVVRHFTIGIYFYTNYDSQPSEETTTNFDYGVVVNVGYKFN